jgi:nucleoside-diphosphate-sugar epimerase
VGGQVVVTGAGGFVGQEACITLLRAGHAVRALARRNFTLPCGQDLDLTTTVVDDLATADHLEDLLAGADAVLHLAARVHRTPEKPSVAAHIFDRDVQMTKALALAAHRVGVRRMVYLSSIKALADRSPNGALARNSPPKPVDPYGRSKLEAERQLAAISASTGLQVVVIRPPLVYGSEASANFRQLVQWVRRGIPLPLAGVQNRRSIVSVDNLANFIVRCMGPIDHPFSIFHVSDPEPVSIPQLLRYVAAGLEVRPRLFSVPTNILERLCALVGRADIAARLLLSLELETQDSFDALAWRPSTSTRVGVLRAVRGMKF